MTIAEADKRQDDVGAPRWVIASLDVKEGRDPLGLQTTTQDRLMPRLLPGILELSRRARYLSFHAYLLDIYRELRRPADSNSLSAFIKAREWEYGLAVLNCPHQCKSVPVGADRLRPLLNRQEPPYPRGESVESPFGGYGLYYRSPLADLGIVARAGTPLGDTPITVDVLYSTERARHLADSFREAVAGTEYVTTWMLTSDAIPLEVLVEYARVGCLCQLRERPEERAAVHEVLFGVDPTNDVVPDIAATVPDGLALAISTTDQGPSPDEVEEDTAVMAAGSAVTQRRRSVAHYLSQVASDPAVVSDEGAYREALWSPSALRSSEHELIAGQWAGLVAKDVWQDSLCSIWSEFCRAGISATHAEQVRGLTWETVRDIARGLVSGPPVLVADLPTVDLVAGIMSGDIRLPRIEGSIPDASLEALRATTAAIDTATSGLAVILELHRRTLGRDDPGWLASTRIGSAWQPSLARVLEGFTIHLSASPTVADTLWWIVHRFIISVHERIAYSKLPEHTFRFRWEEGCIRFYSNGIGRFPLAAVRNQPLSSITWDLGFWDRTGAGTAMLTGLGNAFIAEALP